MPFHVVQRGKLRCFRVRLKEAEEEEFHRADMENRIKNLLSLKNNIESNKVYLCQYNSSVHDSQSARAFIFFRREDLASVFLFMFFVQTCIQ